jgi:prephenate dehydrogenase
MQIFDRVAIIGCGLIGGSLALAMRRHGLARRIVGYSPSLASRDKALRLGVIDESTTDAASAVEGADLVVLAVPVASTAATFAAVAQSLEPSALVMDVGSTKVNVIQAAGIHLRTHLASFVPAHPIAGKAESGVEHAQSSLFEGTQTILTPTASTSAQAAASAKAIWTTVGAKVSSMDAALHDRIVAAVSHTPHLVAFAFMNAMTQREDTRQALAWAGPGFRDFTRIAAGDPVLWRDVMLANAVEVIEQSRRLRSQLEALESMIVKQDGKGLEAAFAQAALARSNWGASQVPLGATPAPSTDVVG